MQRVATGVRNIIARILEIVSESQAMPDLTVELKAGRLTLVADLADDTSQVRMRRSTPTKELPTEAAEGVSAGAVLKALEDRPAGYNLVGLAQALGIGRKVLLKPIVAKLLRDGVIAKVGTLLRLPGAVKRGRRPNNAKKPAPTASPLGPRRVPIKAALKPAKHGASKPRPPAPKPKPTVEPAAPAKPKARLRVRKPALAKRPISTPPPSGTSGYTNQSDDPSASSGAGASPGSEAGT